MIASIGSSLANPAFWLFALFAALTMGGAIMVATSKNLVYSAYALLGCFCGVAGLYIFLDADFLAAAQLIIYVGGILVLILFGVMLTHKIREIHISNESGPTLSAALISGATFLILSFVAFRTDWEADTRPALPTTQELGKAFMSKYLLPFEASSILLLGALIGAAYLARRGEKD